VILGRGGGADHRFRVQYDRRLVVYMESIYTFSPTSNEQLKNRFVTFSLTCLPPRLKRGANDKLKPAVASWLNVCPPHLPPHRQAQASGLERDKYSTVLLSTVERDWNTRVNHRSCPCLYPLVCGQSPDPGAQLQLSLLSSKHDGLLPGSAKLGRLSAKRCSDHHPGVSDNVDSVGPCVHTHHGSFPLKKKVLFIFVNSNDGKLHLTPFYCEAPQDPITCGPS
jgi:hypothetical protein